MKLIFIRHGSTAGNLEGRYIGRTDESLCEEGIRQLRRKLDSGDYPEADVVWCSPMQRCLQTARLIYPAAETLTERDLRECDFGRFENKTYRELSGDGDYQAWIDSGGTLPFPEGEDPERFRERTCRAFLKIVLSCREEDRVAFVVHGGTIMSVLSRWEEPPCGYFERRVKNGCGFECEYDRSGGKIAVLREI
mgnify:CR=1 FL=1